MAIRMMGSKERYAAAQGTPDAANWEIVTGYQGHEAGRIMHAHDCPHNNELTIAPAPLADCIKTSGNDSRGYYQSPCSGPCEPLYMHTTHRGLVIDLGERNMRDDSDFYAVVWNPEAGRPETIEYATTRGWSYPNNAWIDATPEVLEAHQLWQERCRFERMKSVAWSEARAIVRGRRVRVVKGRKVEHGTEGVIMWIGDVDYSRDYVSPEAYGILGMRAKTSYKCGIALSDKKDARGRFVDVVWTYTGNCEVIDPEQYVDVRYRGTDAP